MMVTGLAEPRDLEWIRTLPRTGEVVTEAPRHDACCRECSAAGRLGRGSATRLPVRQRS